jgi:hypothetical protein
VWNIAEKINFTDSNKRENELVTKLAIKNVLPYSEMDIYDRKTGDIICFGNTYRYK